MEKFNLRDNVFVYYEWIDKHGKENYCIEEAVIVSILHKNSIEFDNSTGQYSFSSQEENEYTYKISKYNKDDNTLHLLRDDFLLIAEYKSELLRKIEKLKFDSITKLLSEHDKLNRPTEFPISYVEKFFYDNCGLK